MGWIGAIVQVTRKISVRFESNDVCAVFRKEPMEMMPLLNEKALKLRRKRLYNRNYPFILNTAYPSNQIPYSGETIKFSRKYLRQNCELPELFSKDGTGAKTADGDGDGSNLVGTVVSSEV
jgi:hypothetical protein